MVCGRYVGCPARSMLVFNSLVVGACEYLFCVLLLPVCVGTEPDRRGVAAGGLVVAG